MPRILQRYIVPGLVIQAVIVGGGYATGRELVEFFLSAGPLTALLGMAFTATLFSLGAMVAFELARQYAAFDYRSFCRTYLGRAAFLFELGYFATLLLVLSVVCAAAGQLVADLAGTPRAANSIAFMFIVAALVYWGNELIERVISAWSVIFYAAYGAMFLLVASKFGPQLWSALASSSADAGRAVQSGLSYTGYNVAVLPILIFVARNFTTRSEALIAGALTGPLVLLPGFAFLLALSAFHSQILDAPLPIAVVLDALDSPVLAFIVQLVVIGALIKTGAGLLHGLNERIARSASDAGRQLPSWLRPAVAIVAMLTAVYLASAVGLIELIAHGYRYASYYFLLVFLLPLLTRGAWLVWRSQSAAVPAAASTTVATRAGS